MKSVKQTILQLIAGAPRPTVLLGLSGGADSVFLFRALADLHNTEKISLIALHINHGWRETALRDQEFCAALAAAHNISFLVEKTADWADAVPAAKRNSGSKEADAREIRRTIFEHHRKLHGAAYTALAHHADDQLETFFIRLIRGANLAGLCAMQEAQGAIIRPLLTIAKADILAWLAEHNQPFCSDETNESMAYLRNRIRSRLLPALAACDSRAVASALRTIKHLQEEDQALQEICAHTLQTLESLPSWYKTKDFLACPSALRGRMLIALLIQTAQAFAPSEALIAEIERFLSSSRGGVHVIGTTVIVEKKQSLFRVTSTKG